MLTSSPGTEALKTFAEHTLDEVWLVGAATKRLTRAVTRGMAVTTSSTPVSIEASTDLPAAPESNPGRELLSIGLLESHRDSALEQLVMTGTPPVTARVFLSHRIEGDHDSLISVIRVETVGDEGASLALLTTPPHLQHDVGRLMELRRRPIELERSRLEPLPLLWTSGTGGVLLHESVGHPAGVAPLVRWPAWLRVLDDPTLPAFTRSTSTASPFRHSDLLASERPSVPRRASFRDHPIPRMSTLIASAPNAPFELPKSYVEIELAEGGSWDPLSDAVTVSVRCASLVGGGLRQRLAPFEIVAGRSEVARCLVGARGEPVRYPGVLCSEHGQRLPVGTYCADLLTEGL